VIVHAYIGSKPVELQTQLSPNLPHRVMGDAMRLKQVLINLCSNAVKFSAEGQITLAIEMIDHDDDRVMVKFSVQDNGIGIAPENQVKIFSGFTQAEASTTRRFGGTGLGLAISQHLIELMGGKLELQSALWRGSRFYFSIMLPVCEREAAPLVPHLSAGNVAQATLPNLSGMRILVAEDNFVNQQIANELLTGEGAVVFLANNGQEAVEMVTAASELYDVVLMDMQMPIMDGLTATRTLRETHNASTLPIVAMTANAMDTDREACLQAGMNDHVGKPFNLTHLVSVLRRITGRTP
jgi:CheY-like chemotaxis protein